MSDWYRYLLMYKLMYLYNIGSENVVSVLFFYFSISKTIFYTAEKHL